MRSWSIKDRGYSLSSHPHLLSVHHSSLNKICSFLLACLYPGQFSWLECTLYFHTSEPYPFSGLAHIEPAAAKLLSRFSHVRLCATPWTAAHQASRPWDSPGKNTGVGCHFLLQCMKVKSESEVSQSCPTLCDPMNCSLPGSSVHGIFQARLLKWGAIAFSDRACYPKLIKEKWEERASAFVQMRRLLICGPSQEIEMTSFSRFYAIFSHYI